MTRLRRPRPDIPMPAPPEGVQPEVRRFADCFTEYAKVAIPHDAPDEQREAMLDAFLTGGAMIVNSIQTMTRQGQPMSDVKKRLAWMQQDIMTELAMRAPPSQGAAFN